jgi:hypothetical protein
MNAIIDLFGCCSALVGIFRIDLKCDTEKSISQTEEDTSDTDYYGGK